MVRRNRCKQDHKERENITNTEKWYAKQAHPVGLSRKL